MSTPISAQTQPKTITQIGSVNATRNDLNLGRELLNQSNRSMASSNPYFEITEGARVVDCDQGDDSNGFENGFNITAESGYRSADDFYVSPNEVLNVRSIVFNVFANYPVSSVDLNFFDDDGGMPGSTTIESVSGLILTRKCQLVLPLDIQCMLFT